MILIIKRYIFSNWTRFVVFSGCNLVFQLFSALRFSYMYTYSMWETEQHFAETRCFHTFVNHCFRIYEHGQMWTGMDCLKPGSPLPLLVHKWYTLKC